MPAEISLWMFFVKLIGSCSDIICSWPLGVFVVGLLGRTLVQDNVDVACDWLSATFLELQATSAQGKDQTVHQS